MKKTVKKKIIKPKVRKRFRIQTEYLENVYGPQFLKKLPTAVKILKQWRKKNHFDAIAFSGSSGAGYAFPLSYLLKVPLIHVRKKSDNNHYGEIIEGVVNAKSYLIVDDLIASGATVKRIIKSIQNELNHEIKPVGIFLYASDKYSLPYENLQVITL